MVEAGSIEHGDLVDSVDAEHMSGSDARAVEIIRLQLEPMMAMTPDGSGYTEGGQRLLEIGVEDRHESLPGAVRLDVDFAACDCAYGLLGDGLAAHVVPYDATGAGLRATVWLGEDSGFPCSRLDSERM